MNYPREGYTYVEAAAAWGCTIKEAQQKLNKLVVELHLVYGGKRNGMAFWVPEDLEFNDDYKSNAYDMVCKECGSEFRSNHPLQKFCNTQCSERNRNKRRSPTSRKTGIASRRRVSRFDKRAE